MIGSTISHYRVLRELGRGGMGVVYEAEDLLLGRRAALKFLPDEVAQYPNSLARFQREARAASASNHPNICTVYEIGEQDAHWFTAMELLEGTTLDEALAGKPASLDRLLDWSIQIVEALDAAHSKGVVHRDLKSRNIFITTRGKPKILDFGLAKIHVSQDHTSPGLTVGLSSLLTNSGAVPGTLAFMSPEQARGEEVDARSDLFSLGVVLYQMATARLPFDGKTVAITFDAILNHDPLPLQHWNSQLPEELQRIITKCLEKVPGLRYQQASDLCGDLKLLKRDIHAKPSQSSSVLGGASDTPLSTRSSDVVILRKLSVFSRSAMIVAFAAVVLVSAVLFVGYALLHPPQPVPFQPMTITRVTTSGDYWSAALSPDGNYVATLRRDEQGRDSLWMSHLPTNSNTQIVAASDAVFREVTFSPDGNYVYYRLDLLNGDFDLFRVPVLGGQPQLVVHSVDSPPAFSATRNKLAFVRNRQSENEQSLVTVNQDGSDERTLYSGKGIVYSNPAWSPDGRQIVAMEELPGGLFGIATINPSTGRTAHFTTLPEPTLEPRSLLWMPDGRGLIALCRDRGSGQRQIAYMSYPSAEFHRITNDLNSYSGISLSANGKSIGTVLIPLDERRLDIFPSGQVGDTSKSISVDGVAWLDWLNNDQIVFASTEYLLQSFSLESGEKTLLLSDHTLRAYDPQACGPHSIVFTGVRQSNPSESHIYALDLPGGTPRQLTFGKNDQYMRCTHDGKLLVYYTFDDHSIRKLALPGGSAEILVNGDQQPDNQFDITANGKQVLIVVGGSGRGIGGAKPDHFQFILLALDSEQVTHKIQVENDPEHSVLTPDGKAIAYLKHEHGVRNVWLQPISGGPPTRITNFHLSKSTAQKIISFAWSPDGKRLAMTRSFAKGDVVTIQETAVSPR